MDKASHFRERILTNSSTANIDFRELCHFLKHCGFDMRIKGSHHVFSRDDLEEIINLQPIGDKAKGYQVRQVRRILIKYDLGKRR